MFKYSFIVLIIIKFVNLNPIDENDCSVCKFDEYFNRTNGYGCHRLNDHQTICSCPDRQLSKINQPCRICNRPGICGPKSAKCSEISPSLKPTNNGPYFACFCSTNLFLIGKECPDDMNISSSSTRLIVTTTESGRLTNSSWTSTTKRSSLCPKCEDRSSSSRLLIKPIFIILLNLLHFSLITKV